MNSEPQAPALSPAYTELPPPFDPDPARNAFDFHIYYNAKDEAHARDLHTRISREFPELRIYRFWDRAVGPHPIPMFEVNNSSSFVNPFCLPYAKVNTFTPHQTGALFCWLVANRGPCPVLIHPNTTKGAFLDHTAHATWMGTPLKLKTGMFDQPPAAA
ncbi:putative 21 protein [Mycena sanguinolenta]|uniref:Putative 21 protein n=1 Tax=Mycena sanguinolenta TaxID=230812 RepID=A0A8H6X680_9AGAR|nr:putative 21 protein [Mycena sanguinolenta]